MSIEKNTGCEKFLGPLGPLIRRLSAETPKTIARQPETSVEALILPPIVSEELYASLYGLTIRMSLKKSLFQVGVQIDASSSVIDLQNAIQESFQKCRALLKENGLHGNGSVTVYGSPTPGEHELTLSYSNNRDEHGSSTTITISAAPRDEKSALMNKTYHHYRTLTLGLHEGGEKPEYTMDLTD